jgi:hypothetical protein
MESTGLILKSIFKRGLRMRGKKFWRRIGNELAKLEKL